MRSLIFSPFMKMAFSEEDKHVIKFLRQNKHNGATRFLREFPHKSWSRGKLDKIIRKIDCTGTSKDLPGSGRPRTAQTVENIEEVETLALIQEDFPQTHLLKDKIAREVGKSNVPLIVL